MSALTAWRDKSVFMIIVSVAISAFLILKVPFFVIGLLISTVGMLLNKLVICTNGGRMPVTIRNYADALMMPEDEDYCHAGPQTKFFFLCDKFWWRDGYHSLGDVLLYLGAGTFMCAAIGYVTGFLQFAR